MEGESSNFSAVSAFSIIKIFKISQITFNRSTETLEVGMKLVQS